MSYKTLLVYLNDEHRLPGLLTVAQSIAKANEAHLIGLAVLPPIIIVPGGEGDPGIVIDEHRVSYREQIGRMREAFTSATRESGLSAEWRELDCQEVNPFGNAAGLVVSQARSADLVIASQSSPDWLLSGLLDVDEALVMESGRPVLLVPRTARPTTVATRITVAWDGRREAARALFDAVPLLKAARSVNLVWVNPPEQVETSVGSNDITHALARHGVTCGEIRRIETAANAGAALLEAAENDGSDLLVMGCYGHSRFREFVFGGASRHVLQHMHVPVLMSH